MPDRNATLPPCHGIIPARWGSTRFPGKPLADIRGKPMLWHVFTRAARCPEMDSVTIATDDFRIAEAAEKHHIPAIMTGSHHQSGTDRVKEAADLLKIPDDAIVVNIQGDEPLLEPAMLSGLIRPFQNRQTMVTTLAHQPEDAATAASDPDRVKVVLAADGRALYFSRAAVPYPRDRKTGPFYHVHIGLYAFRKRVLDRFTALSPGRLEQIERLEQLRLLENNIAIHVSITGFKSISVDRPEDLEAVSAILDRLGK